MTHNTKTFRPARAAFASSAVSVLTLGLLVAPSFAQQAPTVLIDGSSTVFPISEAMAEEFQKAQAGKTLVTVGSSGTGGGFKKFCRGETDITGASRPIRSEEIELCKQNGVEFIELPVAIDALATIVSPQNDWATCMTVAELKKIWEPEAQGRLTTGTRSAVTSPTPSSACSAPALTLAPMTTILSPSTAKSTPAAATTRRPKMTTSQSRALAVTRMRSASWALPT